MIINVELEEWSSSSVVRERRAGYSRLAASAFNDEAAGITARQGVFYRNLIRIAVAIEGREIPVDFELPNGRRMYLDRGCIKIAEHAGFIDTLENGANGVVESIRLAWRC